MKVLIIRDSFDSDTAAALLKENAVDKIIHSSEMGQKDWIFVIIENKVANGFGEIEE